MKQKRKAVDRKRVYEVASQIPKGRVSTYGAIAAAAGRPNAARAVGRLMHVNPNPIIVPCHRVVSSDGTVGGYGKGCESKVRILVSEGVSVIDNRIIDFEKKLFRNFH
jgi:O-6-methylguanine DNA methyltransferase